ncbi:unnamed protein product [Notodromas monacha]|uniref:Regulatory protein SIR2 homolog 7 n=1 Tax=Notodromas monacha TaxID=399045 RepID=A0A7R9BX15_9CRUS|nr:unnamed protein product [Notodromas monacha]CAG0921974.1 unnamed protein product [Notodromas monacha]
MEGVIVDLEETLGNTEAETCYGRIHDLEGATPTMCHMALKQLVDLGLIRHIVSQNCDGLHLRSGVPRRKMSEVHGNMYIEACLKCRPPVEYVRDFDVTEKTGRFNHKTGRKCYYCGNDLKDTIVHFGERGKIMWPLNWRGIDAIMDDVDLILCLGSSLKVLKSYERLWARERSAKQKPDLFIVNLQWTPKDKCCSVKLHARCDDFMKLVMEKLQVNIPPYPSQWGDPLRRTATPLHPWEKVTSVKANNWYEKQIEVEVKKSSLKTENDVSSSAEDSTSASWTPSGYFKHVALFRSVPEGVNPYEGVEFPAKTSVTKEQQPSSIPSLPQPGWYGRYLKKIPTTKRSRRRGKGLRCAVGSTAKPEETSQIIQLKIESVSELLPDSDDCVEKIENPLILSQDQDAVIFVDT